MRRSTWNERVDRAWFMDLPFLYLGAALRAATDLDSVGAL